MGMVFGAAVLVLLIAFSGAGAHPAYCVHALVYPAAQPLTGWKAGTRLAHGSLRDDLTCPTSQAGPRSLA
jgi:hypothetical protein